MEADRSLLHAPFSMLSNRVAEQECPYVTKYACIVVHEWNWHIVRKQMSTVNLNNLYAWGD